LTVSSRIKVLDLGTAILYKFLNDFWSGLIIAILLFPIFLLLNLFLKKGSIIVTKVIFLLFVIIQFSLVKYSLTTLLNLGADILGYSLNDMFSTVSSSESFSVMYFLPFVIFPALFFLLYIIINKYFNERVTFGVGVLLILTFGSLKLIFPEASGATYQK